MSNYYSLESEFIDVAYREQKYRKEAEEYRFLRNTMKTNQELKSRMKKGDSFFQRMYSDLLYLWLKHVNIFTGREQHDSISYNIESRKTR
jgi:hypothetical protein